MDYRKTHIISLKVSKAQNGLLWEMAKESASIYNKAIEAFDKIKDFNEIEKAKPSFPERRFLHSQSYQASYQRAFKSIKGYFKALEAFKKDPSKFTGQPQFPKPDKFISTIEFKKSAIRMKDGFLHLSTKGYAPISFRYNKDLGLPKFVTVKLDKSKWTANVTFDEVTDEGLILDDEKILSIDLGVKRVATCFDGDKILMYSGKKLMSLSRLQNKNHAKFQRLKGLKNGSRKHKALKRALNKQLRKIKDTKRDISHKYSRSLVNFCKDEQIGEIVAGDCASIHNSPNCGKQNQKISSSPEQQFLKYVEDKFSRIGGKVKTVPEYNSSKTCPACSRLNKPKGRDYSCPCGFKFDRDGVGALNIWASTIPRKTIGSPMYRSNSEFSCRKHDDSEVGRSGQLTCPPSRFDLPIFGVKYRENSAHDFGRGSCLKSILSESSSGLRLIEEPSVFKR